MVLLLLGLSVLLFRFVAGGIVDVDDSSDLIVYSNYPAWETGSTSQRTTAIPSPENSYEGTWHQSLITPASFTFTFTGTSVAVYGIVPKYQPTTLGFTIDGGTETRATFQPTIPETTLPPYTEADYDYRVQVFNNGGLSAASHTIAMTCYLQSCVFGLDYVEYTAADAAATTTTSTSGTQSSSQTTSGTNNGTTTSSSSATSLSATNNLPPLSVSIGNSGTTDDLPTIFPSDSRIVYQPQQWTSNISCSLSSMVTTGLGASFSFNFTGPSIWIYTASTPHGGKYDVLLNGTNMGVIDTVGSTCKVEASYHIGNLDDFMHTLVVKNANGEIDFLGLRLASSVDQVSGSSITSQGAPNTAAIAGGVIGGAAVLALLIFGIYLCLRSQRRNDISSPEIRMSERNPPFAAPGEAYIVPLSEKQQLLAAEREAQRIPSLPTPLSGSSDHIMVYQSYTKPALPSMERFPSYEARLHGSNENITAQERVPTHPSAPPSFRTRPVTAQYQYRPAADGGVFASHEVLHIAPSDNSQSFGHSLEDAGDAQASSTSYEESEQVWPASAAPPYIDEVLARPDARNLSENDVDAIAQRLAEVMRINNTARGGPGLLPVRTAPPRELIDQLVEEHLGARENMD